MVDQSLRSPPKRVLLVEGHKALAGLLREALTTVAGLEVSAEVASAHRAVTVAAAQQPDLIIIDLHLPDRCGLETIDLLQSKACRAKIILLIEQNDLRYHQGAWQRGAVACVGKDRIANELIRVVRQVLASEPIDISGLSRDTHDKAS